MDLGVTLLAGVLALTIFEGAARKWLFPDQPVLRYAMYFSKDALFVWAAALGMKRSRSSVWQWAPLCAVLVLAPSAAGSMANSNAVGTLLSIRAYLVIPVCAWLTAPLVRSFRDVERCAYLVAVSTVLVGLLGAYQYRLPQSHILNRYDSGAEESRTEATAGHARATGTFAYISGMTVMAGLGAWSGVVLTPKLKGRTRFTRQLGLAALGGSLVCALVSQSRSALLVWVVCSVGGWMLYRGMNQVTVLAVAVLMAVAALGVGNPVEQIERATGHNSIAAGMIQRIQHSDTFSERLKMIYTQLWYGISEFPLGEGIGLGQPGGMYASYRIRASGGTEFEWGRIAFEVGVAGLVAVLAIRVAAGVICWKGLTSTSNSTSRLTLAATLPFFAIMALGNMSFNHTGNSAAWGVMAFALGATRASYIRRIST